MGYQEETEDISTISTTIRSDVIDGDCFFSTLLEYLLGEAESLEPPVGQMTRTLRQRPRVDYSDSRQIFPVVAHEEDKRPSVESSEGDSTVDTNMEKLVEAMARMADAQHQVMQQQQEQAGRYQEQMERMLQGSNGRPQQRERESEVTMADYQDGEDIVSFLES